MKKLFLFASVSLASGLLLANIYTSLIDAKAWSSDIPNSIATAREYFKAVNPGDFFRIFSPLNQVLGLLSLILFWKSSRSVRISLGIALVLFIACDVLTFGYFYPRNDVLFKTASLTDVETLKRVCAEWQMMNWFRSFILLAGLCFSFIAVHKIYTRNAMK
jgi:Domain of unknown function (DUF1772)